MFTIVLLLLSPLRAQSNRSWDNLRSLHVGDRITVVRKDFKQVKGEFTGLTDDAISLQMKQQDTGIPQSKVLRVEGAMRIRGFATGSSARPWARDWA